MKTFAVLAIIALFAVAQAAELTAEQKEKLKAFHNDCLKVSGVDEEIVKKAREGIFTDDAKLKEHLLCLHKKIGFQTESGTLDVEKIKSKLGKNLTEEQVTKALTCVVEKSTPQETAFELSKCWKKQAVKVGH